MTISAGQVPGRNDSRRRHLRQGQAPPRPSIGKIFAVKILEKTRIADLNITNPIERKISTIKLFRHPKIVKLREVSPQFLIPRILVNCNFCRSVIWEYGRSKSMSLLSRSRPVAGLLYLNLSACEVGQ